MKTKLFTLCMMTAFAVSLQAAPNVAAPKPTIPADQVIAVYSDVYDVTPPWGYCEWWNQQTVLAAGAIGGDNYLSYTNFDYLGWAAVGGVINALNMEKFHIDIWAETAGSIGIVPIYGGTGLPTDDQKRKIVNLAAGQWNSFDLDLATDFPGLNLSSIFQFKFDTPTGVSAFSIDNVYFYRTTPLEDNTAPTNVEALVTSSAYFSVTISCRATDDKGVVNFEIFNGETKIASAGGASNTLINITIPNLKPNTEYNLSLVVSDAKGNKAAPVALTAKTQATPAPAPAPGFAANEVISLYSDAYPLGTAISNYIAAWWASPTMMEGTLAEGEKALYYSGQTDPSGVFGWEFATINVTEYPFLHYSIYPLNNATITITPIRTAGGGLETAIPAMKNVLIKGGEWNHKTFDLRGQTGLDAIMQMSFADYGTIIGSFFIDNVYFSKTAEASSTGLEAVEESQVSTRKIIQNGQVYILRDGVRYTILGTPVQE